MMSLIRRLFHYRFVIAAGVVIIVGGQLVLDFMVAKGEKPARPRPSRQVTWTPVAPESTALTPHRESDVAWVFPFEDELGESNQLIPEMIAAASPSMPLSTPINNAEGVLFSTVTPTATTSPASTAIDTATPVPTSEPFPTFTPFPGPTPVIPAEALKVPILMYHYVSEPPDDADEFRRDLSVTPAMFEAHLLYLQEAGYQPITMRRLTYALSGQETLPPQPILITFDDGYRDQYDYAFPLLQKYGYPGVFYIFTYPLDHDDPAYLSWDMVREMHRAGMEFGSHGYRHWDLRGQDVDFLVYEILGSKEAIEAHLDEPARFFSYPSGQYDALAMQVVESAHFWNAVTTELGLTHSFANRYALPRIRVRGGDTVEDLAKNIER